MLSFELSVIDVALATSVAVLFVLFFVQKRDQTTHTRPSAEPKKSYRKMKAPTQSVPTPVQTKHYTKQQTSGFQECVHFFGYLKDLPQNSPVPDECAGCPSVMQCLFSNEQAKVLQE